MPPIELGLKRLVASAHWLDGAFIAMSS